MRAGWLRHATVALVVLGAWGATAARAEPPFEASLARFGSRFRLDLCPQHRGIRVVTGEGTLDTRDAVVGVAVTRRLWALPYSGEHEPVSGLRQSVTPTSVKLAGENVARTLALRVTFHTPFYPGDARLSTAPLFLVEIEIENIGRRRRPYRLHVELPLPGDERRPVSGAGFAGFASREAEGTEVALAWPIASGHEQIVAAGGVLRASGSLSSRQTRSFVLALASYRGAAAARVDAATAHYGYTRYFRGIEEVLAYAIAERDAILDASARFDATVTRTGLPASLRDLASIAFQTLAGETLWLVTDAGLDRLAVIDRARGGLATLDDLHVVAPFLADYWPALLDRALADSSARVWRFAPGVLPPGMPLEYGPGSGRATSAVEAAARILLLDRRLSSRAGATPEHVSGARGSGSPASAIRAAARVLLGADDDGDGLADVAGDPSLAVPWSSVYGRPGSVAFGWRQVAALRAAARHLRRIGGSDEHLLREIDEAVDHALETLETRGFRETHYAISSTDGGGASPLVLGALLDPLRRGDGIAVPCPDRIRADHETLLARAAGAGPRLARHDATVSLGANLIRDLVSAYAGIDPGDPFDGYWAALVEANRDPDRIAPGGFVDRPEDAAAPRSIRGVVAFEAAHALAGLVRGRDELLGIRPEPRRDLEVPLVWLADWDAGRVPWIRYRKVEGGRVTSLRNRALLPERGDLYTFGRVGRSDIAIDAPAGATPRLRGGTVDLLSVEPRGGGFAVELGTPDRRDRRLRVFGLAPGSHRVGVRGEDLGVVSAADLRDGVPIEPAGEGARSRAERIGLRGLRDRIGRGLPSPFTREVAGAVERLRDCVIARLERDREARRFVVEVRPEGEPLEKPAPDPSAVSPVEASMAALVAAVVRGGGDELVEIVERELRPLEVTLDPRAESPAVAITNRFLPPVSGEVILHGDRLETIERRFEALGPGETIEVQLPDASGAPRAPLHSVVHARVDVDVAGEGWAPVFELPRRRGAVRDWLVSRVYTYADPDAFARVEAAELDPLPREASGDANWRPFGLRDDELFLGTPLRHSGRYAFYAHTFVFAEEGGEVDLRGAARGRLRIWVNGAQVFPARGASFEGGEYRARAELRGGANRLLLKIEEGEQGIGVELCVRGADPRLDRGLRAVASPR